ncbi:MAG: Xaa-Pro peptidase family protein [Candidatus Peregrinibacteria bacterium]
MHSLFLKNPGLEALFITNTHNIAYLTGFRGSFGRVLLLKNGEIILFSDSRYSLFAQYLCKKKGIQYQEILPKEDFWKNFLEERNIKTLGIEADHVSLLQFQRLKKAFGKSVKMKKTTGMLENWRKIKTEEEILLIQNSAALNDLALKKTLSFITEGITEQELAWIFEKIAREELGVEGLSFETIVAFGENSAVPHHSPTLKKLEKNMPILIDCGVMLHHFASDMTRCFFYGDPTPEWLSTYNLVFQAQAAGIQKIKSGQKFSDPDTAARDVFGEKAAYFTHSFGHGVGLEVHETPSVSSKSRGKFEKNMVVTAEPGLYFSQKFGIRIEDLLVVENLGAKTLSQFPKKVEEVILRSS